MSANQGYGICGAKNVYSSKVKLDNWVEDEFGVLLASAPRPPVGRYLSDTRAKHCDPKEMVAHPSMTSIKMMSTAELKAKNKDGTSYAQLFNHGNDMTRDERFNTTFKRLFCENQPHTLSLMRQESDLQKQKNKEKQREVNSLSNLQSQYALSTAYLGKQEERFRPRKANGPSIPIPTFGKHHMLSDTY